MKWDEKMSAQMRYYGEHERGTAEVVDVVGICWRLFCICINEMKTVAFSPLSFASDGRMYKWDENDVLAPSWFKFDKLILGSLNSSNNSGPTSWDSETETIEFQNFAKNYPNQPNFWWE